MIKKRSVLLISLTGIVLATTVAFGRPPTKPHKVTTLPPRMRYSPEYTASGDLILPKNNIWREWVFVGSPLTPNALNGGKAGFPEYHNVYMEPGSYEIFKKTGEFPDGTIMFKELQLTLPGENPDGSRTEPSGRGYFPGPFNGADVTVKDTKRYADTGGWGFYNFNHHEPKAATATLKPREECAYCHTVHITVRCNVTFIFAAGSLATIVATFFQKRILSCPSREAKEEDHAFGRELMLESCCSSAGVNFHSWVWAARSTNIQCKTFRAAWTISVSSKSSLLTRMGTWKRVGA
jgi:hypothetical protein